MKIFISGGSGFVGSALARHFAAGGAHVTAAGSSERTSVFDGEKVRYVAADTTRPGAWQEEVAGSDVVINVAGRTIFSIWTRKYKQEMVDSRIETTKNIVSAMEGSDSVLVSASAAGYYGSRGEEVLTELSPPGSDFLAQLSGKWEKEAFRAEDFGVRTAVMRLGIVLGKGGGAVQKMKLPYSLGLGGSLGNGKHWFPWVHMDDVVSAFDFVVGSNLSGVFNLVSPGSVRYFDFSRNFADVLGKPDFFRVPAFILEGALGGLGKSMLASQKVIPVRLARAGFKFRFQDVGEAVSMCL